MSPRLTDHETPRRLPTVPRLTEYEALRRLPTVYRSRLIDANCSLQIGHVLIYYAHRCELQLTNRVTECLRNNAQKYRHVLIYYAHRCSED